MHRRVRSRRDPPLNRFSKWIRTRHNSRPERSPNRQGAAPANVDRCIWLSAAFGAAMGPWDCSLERRQNTPFEMFGFHPRETLTAIHCSKFFRRRKCHKNATSARVIVMKLSNCRAALLSCHLLNPSKASLTSSELREGSRRRNILGAARVVVKVWRTARTTEASRRAMHEYGTPGCR